MDATIKLYVILDACRLKIVFTKLHTGLSYKVWRSGMEKIVAALKNKARESSL